MLRFFLMNILVLLWIKVFSTQEGLWKPVYLPFDAIVGRIENLPANDPRIGVMLDSLKLIANETKNPILKCRSLFWEANFSTQTPDSYSPLKKHLLLEAIKLLDTVKYRYDYLRIRYLMINPVENNNNYVEQYKIYLKLLSEFEYFGDFKNQANLNRWLGILMIEINENEKAIEYLQNANKLYEKINMQDRVATNMINIANCYYKLGKIKESISMLEYLLTQKDILIDTNTFINTYMNLAIILQDSSKKVDFKRKAYKLASIYKNEYLINLTKFNLGTYYLQKNQIDSALIFFNNVYEYSTKKKNSRLLAPSLLFLSNVYEKKGNWERALFYKNRYLLMNDSIQGSDKISEINRIEAGIAIKEYQNQLIIEHQKNELKGKQIVITILIGVGLILASLLILLYIWQKKRMAEGRLLNKELQNQNLQLEIDSRNRELSSTTLILSEKNGILNNLLAQMEKFRSSKEMTNTCELALRKLIVDNLRSENEWESFKLHFEKVHPNFFLNLKLQFPNLTENELRLCAYIRIGMTAKQIGQMISVLPATIKTNRYLLRKKFELNAKDSLDNFIREM